MLTKRTNILFDEELWNVLVTLAAKQNTSVGDLVRTAARKVYKDDAQGNARKRACQAILALRVKQKGKVDYKELINYGRKYL